MNQTKSYHISKELVRKAYKQVKANKGGAGVDKVSIKDYEEKLESNLYKLWNRMSSGSYIPPAVRLVEIPKSDGGKRPLGIPTVGDRIAQMVVKKTFEPEVESIFHEDSYGYRPNKSAIEAIGVTRKRCWRYDWVIDIDIKGFFDNLDHDLMMRAVERHAKEKWEVLYITRWLKAEVELPDGRKEERTKGTPQGGVISPLLANLYLHYAFDEWMSRKYPEIRFERYADDIVVHCVSERQSIYLRDKIRGRFKECKLQLHPGKTKIVYCKDTKRNKDYDNTKFDFLGYSFEARKVKAKNGSMFIGFLPAISNKSSLKIRRKIKCWRIHLWTRKTIEEIADEINAEIRGWINYYGQYYKSKLRYSFYCLDSYLIRWVLRKYKRFKRRSWKSARNWLGRLAQRDQNLFAHWKENFKPAAG